MQTLTFKTKQSKSNECVLAGLHGSFGHMEDGDEREKEGMGSHTRSSFDTLCNSVLIFLVHLDLIGYTTPSYKSETLRK